MFKISCFALGFVLCLSLSIALFNAALAGNQDLDAEKVIAEHLKSISSPAALAETKSRAFAGTASVKSIQGIHGSLSATSMFASVGRKLGIVAKFPDVNYPGECFAYDRKDVSVGHISPGQRSPIDIGKRSPAVAEVPSWEMDDNGRPVEI